MVILFKKYLRANLEQLVVTQTDQQLSFKF